MKKKFFSVILCFLFIFTAGQAASAVKLDGVSVSAKAAVLMNGETGEIIFEKNPDDKMLIASTTKIMTALIVLDKCKLDDIVEITAESANVEGSSAYLAAGEKLTVRELLYALMLSSGNDAAAALAIHISGNIEKFAEEMNSRAKDLGLENTSYKNPHGLDADGHYSTARDLALLTKYALANNDFKDIVSTKTAKVGCRTLTNHNKLLWNIDGAIGVKTGYTKAAGRILVSAVERNDTRYICVTINDPNDWDDHTNIYNKVFSEMQDIKICSKDEVFSKIPVISGENSGVNVVFKEDLSISAEVGSEIKAQVDLPKFIYAGVKKGETAGYITYFINGEESAKAELVFEENIAVDENARLSFLGKIKRLLRLSLKYSPGGILSY